MLREHIHSMEGEMSDYFGPAGIFSTDDPGSDMRQILAEQGSPEEGERYWEKKYSEEEYSEEEYFPAYLNLHGVCLVCQFWGIETYEEESEEGLEDAKNELNNRHRAECSYCSEEQLSFA